MNNRSSGCYVIDAEYNIVNANETALSIYPQLKIGQKCYSCLMGLNEPCGPCPVNNGVMGPTTYTDPIRNISEIVDAVAIEIPSYGPCHMLIFSTVENEASFAATLPTSEQELKNLALIKGLTSDFYDVFSVQLRNSSLVLYRLNGKPLDPDSIYRGVMSYEEEMENYIQKYVHPDDQESLRNACRLSQLQETLKTTESVVLHYRVLLNGELHHFFRKIVRIGDADSFENIVVGIACEDDEVKAMEKQIALQNTLQKVEYNTLTGLLTKEAFFIHSDKLLKSNPEVSFDLCILKLDNLDSIRRQYGSIIKDQLMQSVGDVMKSFMTENTCTAYVGEGSFACFIESQTSEQLQANISIFEEKVRQESKIKNPLFKWTMYRNIRRGTSTEEIYNRVAYLLNTFRNNIPKDYFEITHQMLDRISWDISVEKNFKKSLQSGEFVVWYQPKYSAYTRKMIGAEALVRWIMPNGEMVPPGKFIPILENSGLINRLDEEVFRQVCCFQRFLIDQGLPNLPISVNLSRASLFTMDIPQLYSEIAASYGVSPRLIPIEITESAAVRASMIGEFAKDLCQRGFALHMDDFGAGYSSLASLQMLPFECIKLDKSLVDFIGTQNGENLLKHTIAFAKETGLSVVAEGVEKMEQYLFLKIAGCDAIQGYCFSRPVSEADFLTMLQSDQPTQPADVPSPDAQPDSAKIH